MWAHIRPSAGSDPGGKVRKLDIDVSDEGGKVCARLKGLSLRELAGELTLASGLPAAVSEKKSVEGEIGTFLLMPVWDSVAIHRTDPFPTPSSAMVEVGGTGALLERIGSYNFV